MSPCAEGGAEQLGAGVGVQPRSPGPSLKRPLRSCHWEQLLRVWPSLGIQRGFGHSAPHATGPGARFNKHDRAWAVPRNKACCPLGPVSTHNSSAPHACRRAPASGPCPQPLLSPNANKCVGGQPLYSVNGH